MFKKTKLSRIAVAIAVAMSVGMSTVAISQETSSSIRGSVASSIGEVVAGATVTVTDTRTGSVKTLETNQSGNFSSRGLRVGGPYIVEVVDASGSRIINDVFLNLGQPANLSISLEDTSNLERIAVIGRSGGILTESIGPSSNFTFEDLQNQPSVDRDIKDVIANDPRVTIDPTASGAILCGGVNNRFNSITVDGISQNDNFGLNANGYPTERLPFPFDAVSQVDVQLAPFDVSYGGFTGCNINAVIRSGTNEFTGSVFMDYTNDSLQGNSIEGNKFDVPAFDEKRYGFTVGAPLIKDKLFIFAAVERHEPIEIFDNGPEGLGFAEPIVGLTTDILADIKQIASDVYGYEAGETVNSINAKEEKILIKLDWQINNDHRSSLTYQNTDGSTISSSGLSNTSYAFDDRYYERSNELTTLSAQLFSDWSSNFSTEIRFGRAEVINGQTPRTSDTNFGDVVIEEAAPGVDVFLGADQFRQANQLDYSTDSLRIAGTYYYGDHEIMGGYESQAVEVFNLFVPRSQGVFEFDSVEDFRNGTASLIEYNIPGSLDARDGAAEFTFENSTFFIQDRWAFSDELTLTFGLRYDKWFSDDVPVANDNFAARYGTSNAVAPDFELLQPRLGFNYTYDDTTFIYGGLGLFAGGNPNVWLSNNYSNNGVTILSSEIEAGASAAADLALNGANTANFLFEVPQLAVDGLTGGDGVVNALDTDFNIPALWKFNIGVQKELPYEIIAGFDIIYSQQQDSARSIAINTEVVGFAADGRPIYDEVVDLASSECMADALSAACLSTQRGLTDYYLTNAEDDGQTLLVSMFANKDFDSGLKLSAAYAYMDAEEGSPMNSSTASSNFGNLSVSDLNNPAVATSNFEIEHRFTANIGYTHQFFDGYDTRFNLFAERVKGKPFSFTFDNDPGFGDERPWEDRSLLYVPLVNDPIVAYGEGFDLVAFDQFIADAGLEGSRGTILDRNSENSAWRNRIDLRISQQIPGFVEGHKGSIFFAIRNLGNFLNDDWGVLRQVNFEHNSAVVDATVLPDGTYAFTNFDGDRGQTVDAAASTWTMRVGVDYRF
jgi:hypothetical protein